MKTNIVLEDNEIKSAILEYVKKEYGIVLKYDSIVMEADMNGAVNVSAEIKREEKKTPIFNIYKFCGKEDITEEKCYCVGAKKYRNNVRL